MASAETEAVPSSQDEALAKLAAVSLSLTTDRAELWRDKGITFRPYRDERDMVRRVYNRRAAVPPPTFLTSLTGRWLLVPWSTATSASLTPCSHTVTARALPSSSRFSLAFSPFNFIASLALSGVFIKTCPSISHLCFCNDEMIGCVVCKVTANKPAAAHKRHYNPSSSSWSTTRSCRGATSACCP